MKYKNIILNKLILILLISSLAYNFDTPDRVVAQESSYSVPEARLSHDMVYDESNQQVILFGGMLTSQGPELRDTWLFNCTSDTWVELEFGYTEKPSSMFDHSMVYDSINQQVILTGGWSGETWIFDPQDIEWTKVSSVTHPSSRNSAGMYFDPVNEKVILFGGYLEDDSKADDTWIFDTANNTWTEVFPSNEKPTGRYGHSLVYDSVNQRGLLFGGRTTVTQNDTWAYDYSSNSWTLLHPTQNPEARYWHDAVFDANNQNMFLFGGDGGGVLNNGVWTDRSKNDVWMFNTQNDQWTEISPEIQLVPRSNHAMVYDSLNQRIILFGGMGNDYSDSYGDTWAYDCINSKWIDLYETVNSGTSSTSGSDQSLTSSTSGSDQSLASVTPGFDLSLAFTGLLLILIINWKKEKKRS
ncbi:MAG: Kelch repeat-containing protein [Candidatus Hodarchaeales archaeon]|jgi:N-acetylneuraminic acid mutarotase